MKKAPFALLALPFLAFQCKKNNDLPRECLQGKVIRITCASIIVQVLNDSSVGDDGWEDTFNNRGKYDNVFQVLNTCHLPDTLKAGDVFYFKIGSSVPSDCMVCAMYDAPPKSAYDIKDLSSQPCMADDK